MVVVRQSPRAQLSPEKNTTQWPPRSPFQALLSSPSGRKKWQDARNKATERSPSPSPSRKSVTSSQALRDLAAGVSGEEDETDHEDGNEDEEVLKLQLQQIEARLKLKQLQNSKKRGKDAGDKENKSGQATPAPATFLGRPSGANEPTARPRQPNVKVKVSPIKDRLIPTAHLSPVSKRLGLNAVPKAEDVSLKRAFDGSQIHRSNSTRSTVRASETRSLPRPKSFNERLVESKADAEERSAKRDRLEQIRSAGFGQSKSGTHSGSEDAASNSIRVNREPAVDLQRPSSVGRKFVSKLNRDKVESLRTERPQPTQSQEDSQRQANGLFNGTTATQMHSRVDLIDSSRGSSAPKAKVTQDSGYDLFSEIHLSKRQISHSVVAREMAGKEIYSLPRLLKEVKSPDYEPPDCESDYVVFAILASKSDPFDHVSSHKTVDSQPKDNTEVPRNKFMVLHLCDLKWEVDCFLFGTAFNQFWKLTPGTLLAILNPAILPPKTNQHSGRFSLKLGSSEDCVMEIGVARDLGYCSSVKKNGQPCGDWIDKRKTEACDFHIGLLVDKTRKHQMEVNSMWRGKNSDSENKHKSRLHRDDKKHGKSAGTYHREYGQLFSVNTGMGKSTANLLDAEDTDALHNMTQEEVSRKRIAAAQKERDLAKRLGNMGSGMGAEYLRVTYSLSGTSSNDAEAASDEARNSIFAKPSAAELGLLANKASDAHLSPAKDRKRHFGLGAISVTGGTDAMGWGGARKAGFLQPKDSRLGSPEKGQTRIEVAPARPSLVRPRSQDSSIRSAGSLSPQKKRARFALSKGIREPGRESLPGDGSVAKAPPQLVEEDDDDDLDIV